MQPDRQQPRKDGMTSPSPEDEEALDEAVEESFPASDPPANMPITSSGGESPEQDAKHAPSDSPTDDEENR